MKLLSQDDLDFLFSNFDKKAPLVSLLHIPALRALAKRVGMSHFCCVPCRFRQQTIGEGHSRLTIRQEGPKADEVDSKNSCTEILKLFAKQPTRRFSISKDVTVEPALQAVLKQVGQRSPFFFSILKELTVVGLVADFETVLRLLDGVILHRTASAAPKGAQICQRGLGKEESTGIRRVQERGKDCSRGDCRRARTIFCLLFLGVFFSKFFEWILWLIFFCSWWSLP